MISEKSRQRFVSKIRVNPETGCHEWTGFRMKRGYGQVTIRSVEKRAMLAHRIAWLLAYGELPEEFVLHRCDNPPCVNPEHLFLGDHEANMADMVDKGRHPRNRADYLPKGRMHHYFSEGKKITREIALRVREDPRPNGVIAAELDVDRSLISRIKTRKIWRDA